MFLKIHIFWQILPNKISLNVNWDFIPNWTVLLCYFYKTVLGCVFDIWPKCPFKLSSYICSTLVTDNLQSVIFKPEWHVHSYCWKLGIRGKYSELGKQNQNSKVHLNISVTTFRHNNKGWYILWYSMFLPSDIKQKIHDILLINLNTSFNKYE